MIVPNAFFIVSVSPKNKAPNAIAKNGVNKLNPEHFLEPKNSQTNIIEGASHSST